MTAQKSWRRKAATLLATGTAALVAITGMLAVPATANAAEGPVLTVSKAVDLDPSGETVTVSGSGYDVEVPMYLAFCGDVPLENVNFGFIAAGCTDGSKLVTKSPTKDTQVKLEADGSFETTITVAPRQGATSGTALYTLADHNNMMNRGQDAKVSLAFTEGTVTPEPEPEPEPAPASATASVSKASGTGLDVKVDATNLPGAIYAGLFVKGTEQELTGDDRENYAAFAVPFPKVTDGNSTFTLTAPKARLDRTKQYQVVIWEQHGEITDETIYARADVSVTAAQWDAVFAKPAVEIPFTDMKPGDKFYNEISWMYTTKLSTGVKVGNTVQYMPKANVTREAMAAFLYRLNAPANYTAPKTSKFTDLKPGDKFYKEIAWMGEKGYSTGIKQADGTRIYAPKSSITREAMAAFMYRIDDAKKPATNTASPFIDVQSGDKFYKEIDWMSQSGLSTGINQGNGTKAYAPKANVTREAMAAFLYRAETK